MIDVTEFLFGLNPFLLRRAAKFVYSVGKVVHSHIRIRIRLEKLFFSPRRRCEFSLVGRASGIDQSKVPLLLR